MAESNPNSRLEAFCDGVFAFALTLLVIEIKIPPTEHIESTADFWNALVRIAPSVGTFLLSFGVIFISWVNHHNALKLGNKSSAPFIYANGLLLLSVVFIPFPTALMGEHLLTGHAAPAVILYEAVIVLQSLGWIMISQTALSGNLLKSESAIRQTRQSRVYGYYALTTYSLLAILAIWFPLVIAILTTGIWIFWLFYGMRLKEE